MRHHNALLREQGWWSNRALFFSAVAAFVAVALFWKVKPDADPPPSEALKLADTQTTSTIPKWKRPAPAPSPVSVSDPLAHHTPDSAASPDGPPALPSVAPFESSAASWTEEQIEAKITEVEGLMFEDQAVALAGLTRELRHPQRQVRLAAIQCLQELGSREAIGPLRTAAAESDDSEVKRRTLEAVEFLELPSLTEWRSQRRQESNSRRE